MEIDFLKKVKLVINSQSDRDVSYPETTEWMVEKKFNYHSSDGRKVKEITVFIKMQDRVKISVWPSGKVNYEVTYPFDDRSEEELNEMIDCAKSAVPEMSYKSVANLIKLTSRRNKTNSYAN